MRLQKITAATARLYMLPHELMPDDPEAVAIISPVTLDGEQRTNCFAR